MTFRPARSLTHPRFAWLLWLALLVPLAQFAANWHAQSHWDTERISSQNGKHGLAGDRCDLCLTAAALAAGGAAAEPPAMAHPVGRGVAPVAIADRVRSGARALAYESRAPPFVLR